MRWPRRASIARPQALGVRGRNGVDIEAWLRGLGLERHAVLFRANDLALDVLPDLTDADLVALGLSLGDRKRLLRAIAALRGPSTEPSSSALPDTQSSAPPRLQAERRQLTVMFVDLVGSTALARGSTLKRWVRSSATTRRRWPADRPFEGHVAKFMGDGVLAYFGWPRAHEDEAERAVRAGLAVTRRSPDATPSGKAWPPGSGSRPGSWWWAISSGAGGRGEGGVARRRTWRPASRAWPSRAASWTSHAHVTTAGTTPAPAAPDHARDHALAGGLPGPGRRPCRGGHDARPQAGAPVHARHHTGGWASWVRLLRGDHGETERLSRELVELCVGQGLPVYVATGRILEGALRVAAVLAPAVSAIGAPFTRSASGASLPRLPARRGRHRRGRCSPRSCG